MKIGIAISMYDEKNVVAQTIMNLKNYYGDDVSISIAHSDDGSAIPEIRMGVNYFQTLPNLGTKYNQWQIPSYSLVRNFNIAFKALYELGIDYDLVVGTTGDTLVTDPSNFERRYAEMQKYNYLAYVSQAIGHNFHGPQSNPAEGREGGRLQFEGIADFMPQLFFIDGKLATKTKAFTQIEVVNQYTSEHCLGDELFRVFYGRRPQDRPMNHLGRFCEAPNSYKDGIKYQALGRTYAKGRK